MQTRQDRAAFGTAGRTFRVLGNRVDGANAGIRLEMEVAVSGQVGKGNVGELGEHALGLGSDLKKSVNNKFKLI